MAFQEALAGCLENHGVPYEPHVVEPGSASMAIEPPVPGAWWASVAGFGLLSPLRGETEFDPGAVDPNAHLLDVEWRQRMEAAAFGGGSGPAEAREGSCYDESLREAGFFEQSRQVAVGNRVHVDEREITRLPRIREHLARYADCLRAEGVAPNLVSDPEEGLRRQFEEQGLLDGGGNLRVPEDDPALASARRLERTIAVIAEACARETGLNRAVDRALRESGTGP